MNDKEGALSFKALPPDYPSDAATGAISIGEAKNDFIGYACDKNTQHVWIDINRNLDLTDDPSVHVCPVETEYINHHYADVEFDMPGEPARRYRMDIRLNSLAKTSFTVISGWEGFVELPTGKYPISITDNLNGNIDSGDAVMIGYRGAETVESYRPGGICAAGNPSHLFIDGKNYAITYRFEPGAAGVDLLAEFHETSSPMLEAIVAGRHIDRMVLVGNQGTLFLDYPSATIAVPAGSYTLTRIILNAGKEDWKFESAPGHRYVFEAGKPVIIEEGAPLSNSLDLHKGVFVVSTSYKLRDKTGATYEPVSPFDLPRPQLLVLKGGKQILSTNFEYG